MSGETTGEEWTVTTDGAATMTRPNPTADWVLTAARAGAIVALARRVADRYGQPQDIEWAIDGQDRLWLELLRSRELGVLDRSAPDNATAPFTAAGPILIRSVRPHADPDNIWAHDPGVGKQRLLNREEDHAFWAWAIIETLRLTGVRVEELLELSHHSLVQYRLPATGELVPLLQIAPSKTDAERLLVVN